MVLETRAAIVDEKNVLHFQISLKSLSKLEYDVFVKHIWIFQTITVEKVALSRTTHIRK